MISTTVRATLPFFGPFHASALATVSAHILNEIRSKFKVAEMLRLRL